MKKLIPSAAIATLLCITPVVAQDDVSIMDLKETVYLLMKDVQNIRVDTQKQTDSATAKSNASVEEVKVLSNKVSELNKALNEERKREVLKDYRVSKELLDFVRSGE